MKTLVLGCKGQLGTALADSVPDTIDLLGMDLPELDITDAGAVLAACRLSTPDVIVNAAAYTAVDRAESEAETAMAVNADGPRNIAIAAKDVGARLIHISTDFVFDGEATVPYVADAATNSQSVYGRTKREGEKAVLEVMPTRAVVIRTAWLYSKTGSNFVKTMLRLMAERDELGVVADQTGTPTWADSLAGAVWAFVRIPSLAGIYHWTDGGQSSWHEFAVAIQEEAIALGLLNKAIPISAIGANEYPTPAARPQYSVLDCSATREALNLHPAQWRVNLQRMLQGMNT
jgi:dTDP-4-dehydrorhamnose reductase